MSGSFIESMKNKRPFILVMFSFMCQLREYYSLIIASNPPIWCKFSTNFMDLHIDKEYMACVTAERQENNDTNCIPDDKYSI